MPYTYLNRSDRGNRIQEPIANEQSANADVLFRKALELARPRALEGATCYATVPSGQFLLDFVRLHC